MDCFLSLIGWQGQKCKEKLKHRHTHTYRMPLSRPSLKQVTSLLNKLYPLKYADNSWDNTGLLIDASVATSNEKPRLLLAIDLTEAVAQEAIDQKCNVIVAYHPFLFRKFNRISPETNPQQRTLVKLLQHEISVYSPHTAVDAAAGGVNDWLVEGVSKGSEFTSEVIIRDESNVEGVGMGRLVTLKSPVSILEIVSRIKVSLDLDHVQLGTRNINQMVSTIAICAGSGSSVFSGVDADCYYTGELSHHEQLAYVEQDKSLVICGHSNTERGFLSVMAAKIAENVHELETGADSILVSKTDCSPFQTV